MRNPNWGPQGARLAPYASNFFFFTFFLSLVYEILLKIGQEFKIGFLSLSIKLSLI